MKRHIYKDDECESDFHKNTNKGKPKYICCECDTIYCKTCTKVLDFICNAHEEPRLYPIEK